MAIFLKRTKVQQLIVILVLLFILSAIIVQNWDTEGKVRTNKEKSWWLRLGYKNRTYDPDGIVHKRTSFEKLEIEETIVSRKVVEKPVLADKLRIVHLDLKGAPPKMSYLMNWLPVVQAAGANGLLIEYEDMFPFEGIIKNVSALNAYTKIELVKFLELAQSLKMEIIPLVQTFGHLEFVLKLQEFRYLREIDIFPQEICPAKPSSFELIKVYVGSRLVDNIDVPNLQEMVRQVLALHNGSRYIHIGCDEVFHISACPQCAKRNPRVIFTEHVTKVANWIRGRYPQLIPIIWDDMLRHWSPADLMESGLGEVVEPMVWVYIEDIHRLVPHYIWYMYKKTFPRLWAASAFKGAFGETEIIPDLGRHFENHLAWLRIMKSRTSDNEVHPSLFGGIVLTGWARYDHFAVLAELLPVGTPSLVLNLALLRINSEQDGWTLDPVVNNPSVFRSWFNILQCSNIPQVDHQGIKRDRFQWILGRCMFPGGNLYTLFSQYYYLRSRLDNIETKIQTNGWVSEYNVKFNYTNPWRVLQLLPEEGFAGKTLTRDVQQFRYAVGQVMTQYFDEYTVEEWLEQKVAPLENRLQQIETDFSQLLKRRIWPRRPLHRGKG